MSRNGGSGVLKVYVLCPKHVLRSLSQKVRSSLVFIFFKDQIACLLGLLDFGLTYSNLGRMIATLTLDRLSGL